MTQPQAQQSSLGRIVLSLLTLTGGVSLAVVPASVLSISSHVFPLSEQGVVAVAVLVATFLSQVTSAAIVESRLSTPATIRRVTFPRWLAIVSFVAALAVIVMPTNFLAICVALPFLLASLEVGRSVSVAERHDSRELWAALCVGVGALTGVVAAFLHQPWSFIPVALGICAATLIRSRATSHSSTHADPVVRAWVVTDVGITGVIYPVLNSVILALLGPAPAAAFAAISTVSGVLAIPINFMRVRLLKEHSLSEIIISAAALVTAVAVIVACEFLGVFSLIFGSAWTLQLTLVPLAVACLWRSASILSTIPFAALRRRGRVRVLTIIRGAVAVLTLGVAIPVVHTQEIAVVFAVFLGGELLQALLFELTRRRLATAAVDSR